MTQPQTPPEGHIQRAASLLAEVISELQTAARNGAEAGVLGRIEQQLEEDREQRRALAGQLTSLAVSLNLLVDHLQDLSRLMSGLLPQTSGTAAEQPEGEVQPEQEPEPPEPRFQPGGEGISLSLVSIPGFQALMDVQKALSALDEVEAASVERFQEGDSRVLVQLRAPLSATAIAEVLRAATSLSLIVEESKPELSHLRLRAVSTG